MFALDFRLTERINGEYQEFEQRRTQEDEADGTEKEQDR